MEQEPITSRWSGSIELTSAGSIARLLTLSLSHIASARHVNSEHFHTSKSVSASGGHHHRESLARRGLGTQDSYGRKVRAITDIGFQ